MPREITAYSNPLIKWVRDLRDKRHRKQARQFLAEGLRILTEAKETGRLPTLLFFAKPSADHPLVRQLVRAVELAGGEAIETTPDILSKLSGKDNPQAVVGVFEELGTTLDMLDRSSSGIWLVAERLRDPGNLGTILRTGDAVGAGGLILVGECVDPFSVEAVRASMGALFTVPIVKTEWQPFLDWLRQGPGQLVGLSLDTETDYRSADYTAPTFLLTGNEAQGMPADYAAACDVLVKIPMLGKADSLNAAVATAVMAYEVLAQQGGGMAG
ncbi:RNA 2'-O ribose methyltransferase substrate binding family protein [Sphingomonas sp. S17]|jgi:TrmH family RNA methyltransferase|uniref:RNA methyltransferase n=2 Tax=Sphingomonas paucimobilis TaxID=13689 RepID=A0A411LFT9_SPHPI|nr:MULTISPECIES: RNA methyltransferase [Sphingomonas]EGI56742.1 RNA 2'-O ribose methyltransferase substrate binding family protein [Sphingomonas sp. S17]MBQ1480043.1 RNA methyltransferase [Sphingomonas sp.]MCM3679054.1 RNA methyltransferase [Sphingomonas paucimobilis]MDG5971808.1 RNA methyltransferase [Sphingomonas paucimobilis]NNG58182.1 RNA methyltransferase [Sphingomonas paucimobilis]